MMKFELFCRLKKWLVVLLFLQVYREKSRINGCYSVSDCRGCRQKTVLGKIPQTQQSERPTERSLNFRSAHWKSIHLKDKEQSKQTAATLKRIGCEVERVRHDDHYDVRFRCTVWTRVKLDNDQQIDQWLAWLNDNGMETLICNPKKNTKLPTVQYRLLDTKTAHLYDPEETKQVLAIFKMLGCRIATQDHNGHTDIIVDCPKWTTLAVMNEDLAHTWQAWLQSNEFETKHKHIDE